MRQSLVDIVIPIYGAEKFLRNCLFNLFRSTKIPFELYLIDDCSPGDNIKKIFSKILVWNDERIHLIQNKSNLGFGQSNNRAARRGNSPFILFLNSDTEPQDSFLELMLLNFLDPLVGIVGPKLIFPKGSIRGKENTIQHAGVARDKRGWPYHIFWQKDRDDPIVNIRREINCVTGACLLIRRDLFQEFKGFDPRFEIGAWEDVDLCWGARKAGWKIIYEPLAESYHYCGGSGFEITHRKSDSNKKKLLRKWGNLGSDEYLFS